jgi:hypothetical protein
MRLRFVAIIAICLVCSADAQTPKTTAPSRAEFANLVMEAIQDIDDLTPSSGELEWQITRIQARKSAAALIRAAQNDTEYAISGDVWDYLQNAITARVQLQAGMNADDSKADARRHRALALSHANIPAGRLYSHSSNAQ